MANVTPANDAFRDLLECVKQRIGKPITRAVALVPNPNGGVWVRLIEISGQTQILIRRERIIEDQGLGKIPEVISYLLGEKRNGEPVVALEVLGGNRYRWVLRDAYGAPISTEELSATYLGVVS